MAIETLQPDGSVFTLTNLSGAYTGVDEGVDTPDGVWLTLGDDGTNSIVRASFPTPTGDPTIGANLQKFRLYVRVGTEAGGNTPALDLAIRETGGGTDLAVQTGISVTSYTGEVVEFTWDASVLGTADGSAVEIYAIGQRSGGGPSGRRSVEFDAIEWVADFTVGESRSGSGSITETHTVVSAGDKAASGIGTITPEHIVVGAGSKSVPGTGAISHSHTTVAAGRKEASGAGAVSHGHTVVGTGFKTEGGDDRSGSGTIVETHTVVGVGRKEAFATGSIMHSHTVAATGTKAASGQGTISEGHSVAAQGEKTVSGSGDISHGHTVIGQGDKAATGTGNVSHSHTVVAAGEKATSGTSAISHSHTVVATGFKNVNGEGIISVGHTVTGTGITSEADFHAVTPHPVAYTPAAVKHARLLS